MALSASTVKNVGLKCVDTTLGLCVTVPLLSAAVNVTGTAHAKIIFAVKDQDGCDGDSKSGLWTCSDERIDSSACGGTTKVSPVVLSAATALEKETSSVMVVTIAPTTANSRMAEVAAKAIHISRPGADIVSITTLNVISFYSTVRNLGRVGASTSTSRRSSVVTCLTFPLPCSELVRIFSK